MSFTCIFLIKLFILRHLQIHWQLWEVTEARWPCPSSPSGGILQTCSPGSPPGCQHPDQTQDVAPWACRPSVATPASIACSPPTPPHQHPWPASLCPALQECCVNGIRRCTTFSHFLSSFSLIPWISAPAVAHIDQGLLPLYC